MADKLREALEAWRQTRHNYNWKEKTKEARAFNNGSAELVAWAAVCDIMAAEEEEARATQTTGVYFHTCKHNVTFVNGSMSAAVAMCAEHCKLASSRVLDPNRMVAIKTDDAGRLGLTARGLEILKQPAWDSDYD